MEAVPEHERGVLFAFTDQCAVGRRIPLYRHILEMRLRTVRQGIEQMRERGWRIGMHPFLTLRANVEDMRCLREGWPETYVEEWAEGDEAEHGALCEALATEVLSDPEGEARWGLFERLLSDLGRLTAAPDMRTWERAVSPEELEESRRTGEVLRAAGQIVPLRAAARPAMCLP